MRDDLASELTRDEARKAYGASGIASKPLTRERLHQLRNMINSEMLKAGLMEGTFHMAHPSRIESYGEKSAELRCQSHYFHDREAVTFNADGFVGFAGWADKRNVQPILRGFMAWVAAESIAHTDTCGETA